MSVSERTGTTDRQRPEENPTLRRRLPIGRYAGIVGCAVVLVPLTISVATNPRVGWSTVGDYLLSANVVSGLLLTLELTAVAMAIGSALGALLAVMLSSGSALLRTVAAGYVWLFRGVPLLVQLLIWFNLAAFYPSITFGLPGVDLDANTLITPFVAAVLALSLHEAAYMSEIIRAGLQAVPVGQREAALSIGMHEGQVLRRIVFPQATRIIIPPTGNQVISMLKTTSLVSVIALSELLHATQIISAATYEVIPLLLVATVWYLVVVSVLSVAQHFLEKRFGRGVRR